jgi:hypothetical protein
MNFKYSISSHPNGYKVLLREGQITFCFLDKGRSCTSQCSAFNLYDGVVELKCMPQLAEYGQTIESEIPSLDQVNEFFKSLNKQGSREYYLHYKSNGWMVGKNKVKDWKALAEKWNPDKKKAGTSFNYKSDPSRRTE